MDRNTYFHEKWNSNIESENVKTCISSIRRSKHGMNVEMKRQTAVLVIIHYVTMIKEHRKYIVLTRL